MRRSPAVSRQWEEQALGPMHLRLSLLVPRRVRCQQEAGEISRPAWNAIEINVVPLAEATTGSDLFAVDAGSVSGFAGPDRPVCEPCVVSARLL